MDTAARRPALQRPQDFFSEADISRLKEVSDARSAWLVAHCWGVIVLTWVVVALWTNPLTVLLAVPIIGARQLGLAILSHDGAHFSLFRNRRVNDWVCEWLLSRPLLGGSIDGYRRYHLKHHRYTQQPEDPDLPLSAPFPITPASFRRKVIRDLTGQTGWKQLRSDLAKAFSSSDPLASRGERLRLGARRLGPSLLINVVFLAGFTAAGVWYLYFLLWWLPYLTWNRLVVRIRNIGEHAAVPDNDDRLRNTRTTRANWLERALIAPYFVNYHLEHHLFVACPCYHLPEAHRLLIGQGLASRMEIQPGYPAMLRQAVAA